MTKAIYKLTSCASILCCTLLGNDAQAQSNNFGSFGSGVPGFGNTSSASFGNAAPTVITPAPASPSLPSINNSMQSPAAGYNIYPSGGGLPQRVVPMGSGTYNVYPSAGGLPERIVPSGGGKYDIYPSTGGLPNRMVPSGGGTYNVYPGSGGLPDRVVPSAGGSYNIYKSSVGLPERVVPNRNGTYDIYPAGGGLPARAVPNGVGANGTRQAPGIQ